MEKRVASLETKLSSCLDNLSTVSQQLTAMQNFLHKQFGPGFVEYVSSRGLSIPSSSSSSASASVSSVSGSQKRKATNSLVQQQQQPLKREVKMPQHQPSPILISDFLDANCIDEIDSEMYEDMDDGSDPLAFVEIVDDTDTTSYNNNSREEEEMDGNQEEFHFEEKEHYFDEGEEEESDESEETEENSNIVIVNYRTEVGLNGETHSSPPLAPRLKPKPQITQMPQPRHQPRIVARKNTSLPSSGLGPLPKRPSLQPKPQSRKKFEEDQQNTAKPSGSSSASLDDELSLAVWEEAHEPSNQDHDKNLSAFYDVLPDKSVQCRICQKILKAGWHKFGRHYRTHTGEKPFNCHYCGERFARKDNMHNHVKVKHEKYLYYGHTMSTENQDIEVLVP